MKKDGPMVDFYFEKVKKTFPKIELNDDDHLVDLFVKAIVEISKMDMDLSCSSYHIETDKDDYVIAIEYLDKVVSEDIIYLVADWFYAMTMEKPFDIDKEFVTIQEDFNETVYGGPTIYSIYDTAVKRGIDVNYLDEENCFQWGMGKKHIRAISTTLHIDSIRDTEFTSLKDKCEQFLSGLGFPVPKSVKCYNAKLAVEIAEEIGYPIVVKPVTGHKGENVTTGIMDKEHVTAAFNQIINDCKEKCIHFDGVLVQEEIYGTDHRILTVGSKFAACLERVPAFVIGDGEQSIAELIEEENSKLIRLDNARSPLCKIVIDEDLIEFLKLQSLSIATIPEKGSEVVLRRVANISAGGVSRNVSDIIHPDNIELVESIAKYFDIVSLGIDVLAKDISKSWKDGDFGIIEINAGPGIFMHLAPAYGESIDIPGKIIDTMFKGKPNYHRVPIIAGNRVDKNLADAIGEKVNSLHNRELFEYSSLTDEGVSVNGKLLFNNRDHDQNCKFLFRNPNLDFAIINHNRENIHDYGIWHTYSDLIILDRANYAENILKRDLTEDGVLIEAVEVENDPSNITISTSIGEERLFEKVVPVEDIGKVILEQVGNHLDKLIDKYE
jgi:cyanophycin synthetase